MKKINNLIDLVKANELLKKKEAKTRKKYNVVVCVLIVIGAVAAVAAIAYAVYRHLNPDYLDDFEDDFEDEIEDDEDDEEDEEDFFVDEGENLVNEKGTGLRSEGRAD